MTFLFCLDRAEKRMQPSALVVCLRLKKNPCCGFNVTTFIFFKSTAKFSFATDLPWIYKLFRDIRSFSSVNNTNLFHAVSSRLLLLNSITRASAHLDFAR